MSQLRALIDFLDSRRWKSVGERGPFLLYAAPELLGLERSFRLTVPATEDVAGFSRAFDSTLAFVADVYDFDNEDLSTLLSRSCRLVAVRLMDRIAGGGSVPLDSYSTMLNRLTAVVLYAANYAATGDPLDTGESPVARDYLHSCTFMQTQHGSFVTRVQLPISGRTEKQQSLFAEPERVVNADVADRVYGVINFASTALLSGDYSYDPEHLEEYRHILNARLLRNVVRLFEESGFREWEFRFEDLDNSSAVRLPPLTPQRLSAAKRYVNDLITGLREQRPIVGEGMVVNLRSRDPKRGRGVVEVEAFVAHRQATIMVSLDSQSYGKAIEAHRGGKLVRVSGPARRLQTYYRIDEPTAFELLV